MHITRKAAKVWEPAITTTEQSRYARDTTPSATPYPARLRGKISGQFVIGRMPPRAYVEDSTWGWCDRMTWDPEFGYTSPTIEDDEGE